MDDRRCAAPIVSVASYRIAAVHQHAPTSVDDLRIAGEVAVEVLDVAGRPIHIVGRTREEGGELRLEERRGTGEVRTWHVDQAGPPYHLTVRTIIR